MNVRYRVDLTQYERNQLGALLSGGKHPSRKLKRAQILLAAAFQCCHPFLECAERCILLIDVPHHLFQLPASAASAPLAAAI
jgi:hypothetical protein